MYKVDRLSRSLLDFGRIMDRFEKRSISFVSVTQQFNTSVSLGRLTLNILLSFAQFERELISERTRDKMSAARRKGKWVGGIPVLGYDVAPEGGRLILNEQEAQQVRAIYDLYVQRRSVIAVVQELDRLGWRTKQWVSRKGAAFGGQEFTQKAVLEVLRNVIYSGRVRHKGQIYAGEHQPIIEPELWSQINAPMDRPGRRKQQPQQSSSAMLQKLLWCQTCDQPMLPTGSGNRARRYRYYTCRAAQQKGWSKCPSKSVPAEVMEASVLERLRELGSRPELACQVYTRYETQVRALAASAVAGGCSATLQVDRDEFLHAWSRFHLFADDMGREGQAEVVHKAIERIYYDGASRQVRIRFRTCLEEFSEWIAAYEDRYVRQRQHHGDSGHRVGVLAAAGC